MTLDDFKKTLADETPPEGCSPVLQALWYQANGNWDQAHKIAQNNKSSDADWTHAFLHRVEGDQSNAGYWYRRSGQPVASCSISEEWDQLATAFL